MSEGVSLVGVELMAAVGGEEVAADSAPDWAVLHDGAKKLYGVCGFVHIIAGCFALANCVKPA
jgi:hypothetical protein